MSFVLAQKWISANQIVSGDQGETSTILTFVNGIGDVCPPMVIQKEQRDDQSLVGTEDEMDHEGVFNEVPGSLSSSEMIFCTLDCQEKNVTLDLNLTVYCRRQQRLAFLSHQQRGL